jgi:1-pyrroline-4-hydroxy-2-carboxylate deaminase
VEAAFDAAPDGFVVIPAVGAYGARESVRWAEQDTEIRRLTEAAVASGVT